MNVFESLENLQVSEGCLDDIVGLIRNYLNEDLDGIENRIIKKYGKPDYGKNKGQGNKSAKLMDKFISARVKEYEDAVDRETDNKINKVGYKRFYTKANIRPDLKKNFLNPN